MENEELNDNQNSDRVLLAVLVTFLGTPLVLYIGDIIGISHAFYNLKIVIGLAISLAIIADRIYVNKQKKKHITRRSNGTNNP